MKGKKAVLLFCLIISVVIIRGQEKKVNKRAYHISGSIKGYKSGTLEMHLLPKGGDKFEESQYMTSYDSVGLFSFTLPYPGSIGDRIALIARPENAPAFFVFSSIIEPSDKVAISIKKVDSNFTFAFSGKGANKYKCLNEVYNSLKSFDKVEMPDKNVNQYYTFDDTIAGINKKCMAYKTTLSFQILRSYKNKISEVAYKIMQYDLDGIASTRCLFDILNLYHGEMAKDSNVRQLNKVFQLFNMTFNHIKDTSDAHVKFFSPDYTGYLFVKAYYGLVIRKERSKTFTDELYAEIRRNYRGPLGDYLIIQALNSSNRRSPLSAGTLDSLWKDAYEVITTPSLKNYVAKHVNHKSKGKDAFKFSLPDVNGNIVKLEDFKGKVVLIDFWFTGCAGCAGYVRRLKEDVYPKFRNDSNLVFISISGDKNRNTWIKSVGTGVYSGPGFIDLYTEGKGFEHPLTKYYDFNGGPHSLLIDKKGKIFHGNPPTLDSDSLVALIESALSGSE